MAHTNRKGDKIKIKGSYQYEAIHNGNIFQSTWHKLKLQTATVLANVTAADKILDVGCGSGILVSFLSSKFDCYIGLDANKDAIDFAQKTYAANNVSFKLFQVDDLLQMPAASVSRIFFLEVIEHITSEQGASTLQQFYRLLQPGGICVISTPNRKSLWPIIEWGLDFFKLTPPLKEEQHEKLYSVRELRAIAIQSGFYIKKMYTMNGLAPWISFLGKKTTDAVHQFELKNNWLPGSLIVTALEKPAI